METQNYIFFSKNFKIDRIEFCPYPEKRNHPRCVNISPTLVIDTAMGMSLWVATSYSMETQKFDFFCQKSSKLNFVHTLSVHNPENKSPWLRQYKSYISN